MAPRLSCSGVLDISLHPPGPPIGFIAVNLDGSDCPMTSRNDGKQERGGCLYVAVQDEFRDGRQPVQVRNVHISVLFVIEKEKPVIHNVIGNDEWTDEILFRKIIRLV